MRFDFLQFVFIYNGVPFYYKPPNIAINMDNGKQFVNDKIYLSYKNNRVTNLEEEEKNDLMLKYVKNVL